MEIVPLTKENLTREVLDILEQLAPTKNLTLRKAKKILERQNSANHFTFICVEDFRVVGVGSIIITERFLHDGKRVAHFEDIAISKDYHGCGYGKKLVQHLKKVAKKYKCRKAILDCNEENIPFYEKCGMKRWHNQMRMNFNACISK